jgi:hypothetical protein
VLLIDELDKSDVDLPNDLLNIFEDGQFDIAEPQPPSAEKLVAGHLGEQALAEGERLIEQFMESRDYGDLATDQLLNAIYLVTSGNRPLGATRERMVATLFRPLGN